MNLEEHRESCQTPSVQGSPALHLTPSFATPLTSEELHWFSSAEEETAVITESMEVAWTSVEEWRCNCL